MVDALRVTTPDRVIVTTDYEADNIPYGVRGFVKPRPAKLCQDDTPMRAVLKYVAANLYTGDIVLLMQPNCYHPERAKFAQQVLDQKAGMTAVRYPDFWHPAYRVDGILPYHRQGLEPAYRPDGLIYRIPAAHLILLCPFRGPLIPVEGTINVDTEDDWVRLTAQYASDGER